MNNKPRTLNEDSTPQIKHVYYYRVGIPKPKPDGREDYMEGKDPYFLEEKIPVVLENGKYIVLDDWYFTKVTKEKNTYDTCLDDETIEHRKGDSIFCGGIFFSLYTAEKKQVSKIKAKVKRFVDKELSYLGAIDLSFIK